MIINKHIETIEFYLTTEFINLQTVYIPSSVTFVKQFAFEALLNLKNIYYDGLSTLTCERWAFRETLSSIEVPLNYPEDTICEKDAISTGFCVKECQWEYNHNTKALNG